MSKIFTKKELWQKYEDGVPMAELADEYELSYSTVQDIVQRQVPRFLHKAKKMGFEI